MLHFLLLFPAHDFATDAVEFVLQLPHQRINAVLRGSLRICAHRTQIDAIGLRELRKQLHFLLRRGGAQRVIGLHQRRHRLFGRQPHALNSRQVRLNGLLHRVGKLCLRKQRLHASTHLFFALPCVFLHLGVGFLPNLMVVLAPRRGRATPYRRFCLLLRFLCLRGKPATVITARRLYRLALFGGLKALLQYRTTVSLGLFVAFYVNCGVVLVHLSSPVGIGEIGVFPQFADDCVCLGIGEAIVDLILDALKAAVIHPWFGNVLGGVVVAYLNAIVGLEVASVFGSASDHFAVNHRPIRLDVGHDVVIAALGVLLALHKLAVN